MSCVVGRRRSSDPALLWLWCRLAATALIRPLAWETPYAASAALKKQKPKKQKRKKAVRQQIGEAYFTGHWEPLDIIMNPLLLPFEKVTIISDFQFGNIFWGSWELPLGLPPLLPVPLDVLRSTFLPAIHLSELAFYNAEIFPLQKES